MLTTEYDCDTDMRVKQEEAREETREKERLNAVKNIMLNLKKTSEEAMDILGYTEEERCALRKELEK